MPDSIQNEADIYVHNVALTKCQQQNVETTNPCYHNKSKLQILATTTRRYYNPCYHKTSRLQILATTIRRNYKSLLPQHVDTTNPCYHETSILKFLLPQNVDTTNPCYHKTSILQIFAFTKRRYLKILMLYNKTLLPQIGVPHKGSTTNVNTYKTSTLQYKTWSCNASRLKWTYPVIVRT